jgi:hypothetical protein
MANTAQGTGGTVDVSTKGTNLTPEAKEKLYNLASELQKADVVLTINGNTCHDYTKTHCGKLEVK